MTDGRWRRWPCTRACTAFFRIPYTAVVGHVPPQLGIVVDRDGWSQIELGYVRFLAGTEGLPATDELAWAIRVERVEGWLGDAFFAMNITASQASFLAHQRTIGFVTTERVASFREAAGGDAIHVEADGAPICVVRDQTFGRLPIPFYPLSTEVWTRQPEGPLQRRLFRWSGAANVVPVPSVAWTLVPHPFFRGVDVSRAEPLPTAVLISDRVAVGAEQRFTRPEVVDAPRPPRRTRRGGTSPHEDTRGGRR